MQIGGNSGVGGGAGVQPGAKATDPGLEKAAKAFEAIFLRQMIASMRSSSLTEGLFDSSATEQFRDMSDSRMAEQMAGTSKFGIADLLLQQFGAKTPLTPSVAMKPEIAAAPEQKGDAQ